MAFGLSAGAVSLIGAGAGLLSSGNKNGGAGVTSKEPWAPAQQYLKDNLAKNAELQKFYEQNPFNAQQKTGYQNTFNDLDNFRNNTAPGLMGFANNAMTGTYQRPQFSRPGMAGYGGTPQTNQTPGGLLAMQPGGSGGPFSVARVPQGADQSQGAPSQYGQINWNAINPHSAQNAPVAPAAPAPASNTMTPEQLAYLQRLMSGNGGNQGGESMGGGYGIGGGGGFGGGYGLGSGFGAGEA
jgi:hypothetical protein